MSRFLTALTTLMAMVVFLFSIYALQAEFGALSLLRVEGSSTVQSLQQPPQIPLSIRTQYAVLSACDGLIASVTVLTKPLAEQKSFLEACANWADETLRASPANAFAATVAAEARGGLGDHDLFDTSLVLSQRLAPNEGWLAALRVAITERHIGLAESQTLQLEARDIGLLASSYKGVEAIARRYVTTPAFRERVTAAVETLSPDIQRRFVRSIMRAAAIWGYKFDA